MQYRGRRAPLRGIPPVGALAAAILAAGALTACGGRETASARSDTTPVTSRDVAILGADTATRPQLADVPAPARDSAPVATTQAPTTPAAPASAAPPARRRSPRPAAPTASVPAAAPAAPPGPSSGAASGTRPGLDSAVARTATVPAGTTLRFTASRTQCTNTLRTGDRITAPLAEPVRAGTDLDLPAGATGVFEVAEARTAQSANDQTTLALRLVAVQHGGRSYPVNATTLSAAITRVRSASKQEDLRKVAGGAVAGAIAGRLLGRSARSTIVGAAAGAAAGTAAAAATGNADSCLQEGGTLSVRLEAPLTLFAPAVP